MTETKEIVKHTPESAEHLSIFNKDLVNDNYKLREINAELLEALKNLVNDDDAYCGCSPSTLTGFVVCLRCKAEMVIEKAEGK